VQVDPVGAEPIQRRLTGRTDVAGGHVRCDPRARRLVKRVPELRGDHHLITAAGQRAPEYPLAVPRAVRVRRVDQRDTEVERLAHRGDRLAVIDFAHPASRPPALNGPPMAHAPTPIALTSIPLRPSILMTAQSARCTRAPGQTAGPHHHASTYLALRSSQR